VFTCIHVHCHMVVGSLLTCSEAAAACHTCLISIYIPSLLNVQAGVLHAYAIEGVTFPIAFGRRQDSQADISELSALLHPVLMPEESCNSVCVIGRVPLLAAVEQLPNSDWYAKCWVHIQPARKEYLGRIYATVQAAAALRA